jgi:hypothetical protein
MYRPNYMTQTVEISSGVENKENQPGTFGLSI